MYNGHLRKKAVFKSYVLHPWSLISYICKESLKSDLKSKKHKASPKPTPKPTQAGAHAGAQAGAGTAAPSEGSTETSAQLPARRRHTLAGAGAEWQLVTSQSPTLIASRQSGRKRAGTEGDCHVPRQTPTRRPERCWMNCHGHWRSRSHPRRSLNFTAAWGLQIITTASWWGRQSTAAKTGTSKEAPRKRQRNFFLLTVFVRRPAVPETAPQSTSRWNRAVLTFIPMKFIAPGIHTHPLVSVPTGQKHLPQAKGKTAMPKHTVSRQPLRKGGRRTRLRSDRTLGTEKTVLWNQKLQFGGKELEEAFKGG